MTWEYGVQILHGRELGFGEFQYRKDTMLYLPSAVVPNSHYILQLL